VTFLADERVDKQIVDELRAARHGVLYIAEMDPGIRDEAVLELSRQAGTVLLTADKDFGELIIRQRRLATGVLLIRLFGLSPENKTSLVAEAISRHAEQLSGAFSVLSAGAFRIRRM
jgi:predicted nuclease of predicted toxin-antitoxin system